MTTELNSKAHGHVISRSFAEENLRNDNVLLSVVIS